MKKLLITLSLLALAACHPQEVENPFVGDWVLDSTAGAAIYNQMKITPDTISWAGSGDNNPACSAKYEIVLDEDTEGVPGHRGEFEAEGIYRTVKYRLKHSDCAKAKNLRYLQISQAVDEQVDNLYVLIEFSDKDKVIGELDIDRVVESNQQPE